MLKLAQTGENKSSWIDFSIYLLGGRQSVGGIGLLPDLKHFSELHQLLLMGSDAILALSQPPNALRFVLQAGWRQALHQKCGTTYTALFKRSTSKRTDFQWRQHRANGLCPGGLMVKRLELTWHQRGTLLQASTSLQVTDHHHHPTPCCEQSLEINPHSLGAFSSSTFT